MPAALGQCAANQVYRECGEACVRTCSNPQHACSSFCTFGCFCPGGEGRGEVAGGVQESARTHGTGSDQEQHLGLGTLARGEGGCKCKPGTGSGNGGTGAGEDCPARAWEGN